MLIKKEGKEDILTPKNTILTTIVAVNILNLIVLMLNGVSFIMFTFIIVVSLILAVIAIKSEREFEDEIFKN